MRTGRDSILLTVALLMASCGGDKDTDSPDKAATATSDDERPGDGLPGKGDTIRVEAGWYAFGSPLSDPGRFPREEMNDGPQWVDAFYIDAYEYPNDPEALPRTDVTWSDAAAACASEGKRLCSEYEWEAACEGPEVFRYGYGDEYVAKRCHAELEESAGLAFPGAAAECRSGVGAFDMTGNAAEWTTGIWTPGSTHHVSRGGAYTSKPRALRCANRLPRPADTADPRFGFRCCKSDGEVTPAPRKDEKVLASSAARSVEPPDAMAETLDKKFHRCLLRASDVGARSSADLHTHLWTWCERKKKGKGAKKGAKEGSGVTINVLNSDGKLGPVKSSLPWSLYGFGRLGVDGPALAWGVQRGSHSSDIGATAAFLTFPADGGAPTVFNLGDSHFSRVESVTGSGFRAPGGRLYTVGRMAVIPESLKPTCTYVALVAEHSTDGRTVVMEIARNSIPADHRGGCRNIAVEAPTLAWPGGQLAVKDDGSYALTIDEAPVTDDAKTVPDALVWRLKAGTARVFAHPAKMHELPDRAAPAAATLPVGTEVTVEKLSSDVISEGGFSAWYEVSADGKRGHVWGYDLTTWSNEVDVDGDGDTELVLVQNATWHAYDLDDMSRGWDAPSVLRVRIVSGETVVADYEGTDQNGLRIEDGPALFRPTGFKGEPRFLRIDTEFTSETFGKAMSLYFIDGTKLEEVFVVSLSEGEGGEVCERTLTFPDDSGGRPDTIIVTQTCWDETERYDDDDDDGGGDETRVTEYVWTGKTFTSSR